MKRLTLGLVHLYQVGFSPYFPMACRYMPSCSQYSREAVVRYGVVKGVSLTLKRLVRCFPWGGRGYDPVP